jgi:hypothetical protein
MGENRNTHRVLVGKREGNDHLENLSIGGKIILNWVIEKYDGVVWIALIWLRVGTSGRLL